MVTEVDAMSKPVLEVCLIDVLGDEYVYWVDLADKPDAEDGTDWAINRALAYHADHIGTSPEPDGDDDLSVFAYEPFDRPSDEYVEI